MASALLRGCSLCPPSLSPSLYIPLLPESPPLESFTLDIRVLLKGQGQGDGGLLIAKADARPPSLPIMDTLQHPHAAAFKGVPGFSHPYL